MLEINKMEPHSGLQAFTLHGFAYKSEDSERNQLGRSYSCLRYVRARVKRALKSMVNPIIAPKPIQYHFGCVNTP
jgi:hypothetical protein